ncbi:hypothetical protein N2152v2_006693 [Parachlorella kessleri]
MGDLVEVPRPTTAPPGSEKPQWDASTSVPYNKWLNSPLPLNTFLRLPTPEDCRLSNCITLSIEAWKNPGVQLQEIQDVKDLDSFNCPASSAPTGKAGSKKLQEGKGGNSQVADGKPASRRQRQSAASFYKARPSVLPLSLRQAKPSG